MGRTGKSIVRANIEEVLSDLLKAYADEWLAHYQYWVTAQWIRGIDADTLRPLLLKQSEDELKHAEALAQRIIQLGGEPVLDFSKLLETSGCGYIAPPKDPTDLRRVVEDVLKAESCAIKFYNKMVEKYRETDYVTHEIFEDLLKDEVEDEEEWEKIYSKL
ncbi:MAG: ferritin-like domain-containing protein [Aigarchaeota archaeon]|nr:ferritin-like domain-containing protein [Candidatus Calditenuaceae archaeon]